MQEIITLVSTSIAGGVFYDSVKELLGKTMFDKLSQLYNNNQDEQFKTTLEKIIKENKELKDQLIDLQKNKTFKCSTSINIKGNNSGIVISGDNNNVNCN